MTLLIVRLLYDISLADRAGLTHMWAEEELFVELV